MMTRVLMGGLGSALLLMSWPGPTWAPTARTIHVDCANTTGIEDGSPEHPYNTIQEAIVVAVNGDTVLVQPCVYYENINFLGKAITVAGTDPLDPSVVATTVVSGTGSGRVVTFASGEGETSALEGFTVTGTAFGAGGIYCRGTSPTISHNIITGNGPMIDGGGIYCYDHSSPTIANNTITGNAAADYGGGICCEKYSHPTIADNIITGNNAFFGGGICCSDFSSPTISNNTIIQNRGSALGGGIYCYYSDAIICNNTIAENTADLGAGIDCDYPSSPTIANNNISGNSATSVAGGIYCHMASPTVTNNTVTANSAPRGGAVYVYSASPKLSNNVLAFNSSGIYRSSGTPTLRNNCVYNPDGDDYSGLAPGVGDISQDPRLAAVAYGRLHLQPDSPCIDAGDDTAVQPAWVDMDGQPRLQGAHVDMGADESDGTWWDSAPVIVRVSPSGDDANDGSDWDHAKLTVQAAIDAAAAQGGEVWAAAGTYYERITLRPHAYVYGGFAGSESARGERDWEANTTILDASAGGSVVTASGFGHRLSAIDGFTIRNGSGTGINNRDGGGIYCTGASPIIMNNAITGNSTPGGRGAGIFCRSSSPAIVDNVINGNSATSGAGIYSAWSQPIISNNRIAGNDATDYGGGIYSDPESLPTISSNHIAGNSATVGGGIHCDGCSPAIVNNRITGNSAAFGGGICCDRSAPPAVTNNTIAGNTASDAGGAIYCDRLSSPAVSNNVVAFNSSGICRNSGTPTLRNNCVHNPAGYDYSGVDPGEGDVSADPLLVDFAGGDYHLTAGSPCVDSGWNDAPGLPDTDMDGDPRPWPSPGVADMGADEWMAGPLHFQLRGGCWHLITIPCQPLNPDPWEVFDELRPPNKSMDLLSGSLYRYDPVIQGYLGYQQSSPMEFGPVTPGDGYWLWLYDDETISYDVLPWSYLPVIHLEQAGWHMVGPPHPAHSALADTSWQHAGLGPHPFSMISEPGDTLWAQDPLYCWSPSTLGYLPCGLEPQDDDHLRAFKGYWLYTFVDDVTLEVPAP